MFLFQKGQTINDRYTVVIAVSVPTFIGLKCCLFELIVYLCTQESNMLGL